MRKSSILESEKTLDDVLNDMVQYLIEKEVRSKPYISVLSKKQLWFGNGPHFRDAPNYMSSGLRANAGIRIPTDLEIEKKNTFYGYKALVRPWAELNTITNKVMRNKILKKTIDKKPLADVRVLMGRGYIRKDGTLDPSQTKGISVYILFMADREFRLKQNVWIENQPEWVRRQVARNQHTHIDILQERQAAASEIVKMNRKLIAQDEWKELDAAVDLQLLDWE